MASEANASSGFAYMSSSSFLGPYSFPSISAIEQLAVQMPHSKQFLSLSASRILWRICFTVASELSTQVASLSISVVKDIKVYKCKGFLWTLKCEMS